MGAPPTKTRPLFEPEIVRRALTDALRKLDPRVQARNPVMFVVVRLTYLPVLALGPIVEQLNL